MTEQKVGGRVKGRFKVGQHKPHRLFAAVSHLFRFISCNSFKNMEPWVICGGCAILWTQKVDVLVSGLMWSHFTDLEWSPYSLAPKSLSLWLPGLISTPDVANEHPSHLLGTIAGTYQKAKKNARSKEVSWESMLLKKASRTHMTWIAGSLGWHEVFQISDFLSPVWLFIFY